MVKTLVKELLNTTIFSCLDYISVAKKKLQNSISSDAASLQSESLLSQLCGNALGHPPSAPPHIKQIYISCTLQISNILAAKDRNQ